MSLFKRSRPTESLDYQQRISELESELDSAKKLIVDQQHVLRVNLEALANSGADGVGDPDITLPHETPRSDQSYAEQPPVRLPDLGPPAGDIAGAVLRAAAEKGIIDDAPPAADRPVSSAQRSIAEPSVDRTAEPPAYRADAAAAAKPSAAGPAVGSPASQPAARRPVIELVTYQAASQPAAYQSLGRPDAHRPPAGPDVASGPKPPSSGFPFIVCAVLLLGGALIAVAWSHVPWTSPVATPRSVQTTRNVPTAASRPEYQPSVSVPQPAVHVYNGPVLEPVSETPVQTAPRIAVHKYFHVRARRHTPIMVPEPPQVVSETAPVRPHRAPVAERRRRPRTRQIAADRPQRDWFDREEKRHPAPGWDEQDDKWLDRF